MNIFIPAPVYFFYKNKFTAIAYLSSAHNTLTTATVFNIQDTHYIPYLWLDRII